MNNTIIDNSAVTKISDKSENIDKFENIYKSENIDKSETINNEFKKQCDIADKTFDNHGKKTPKVKKSKTSFDSAEYFMNQYFTDKYLKSNL